MRLCMCVQTGPSCVHTCPVYVHVRVPCVHVSSQCCVLLCWGACMSACARLCARVWKGLPGSWTPASKVSVGIGWSAAVGLVGAGRPPTPRGDPGLFHLPV